MLKIKQSVRAFCTVLVILVATLGCLFFIMLFKYDSVPPGSPQDIDQELNIYLEASSMDTILSEIITYANSQRDDVDLIGADIYMNNGLDVAYDVKFGAQHCSDDEQSIIMRIRYAPEQNCITHLSITNFGDDVLAYIPLSASDIIALRGKLESELDSIAKSDATWSNCNSIGFLIESSHSKIVKYGTDSFKQVIASHHLPDV